jgi:hypothetical protein
VIQVLNEDYKEMLQCLKTNDVRFLIVGAYALGAYGYPRATGDMDIWVMAAADNSEKLYKALKEFGAPLTQIDEHAFAQQGIIFQVGIAPRRIDIITKIDGVEFEGAYSRRKDINIEGLAIPFISKADLIKNKLATGREKDLIDVEQLQSKPE